MRRKFTPWCRLSLLLFSILLFYSWVNNQEVYAQEQNDDVIYFKNGRTLRGTIIDIREGKIRIKKKDGNIYEGAMQDIIRFTSNRPVEELYKQPVVKARNDTSAKENDKRLFGLGFSVYYASIEDTSFKIGGTSVTLESDANIDLNFNLTHIFNEIFSLEIAAGFFRTDMDISASGVSASMIELSQYSFLATGLFHLPLKTKKISPFLGIGAGYYVNDFGSSTSAIRASLNNDFGFHVKAGCEFFVTERSAINLEAMYIWNEAEGEIYISGLPLYKGDIELNTFKLGVGFKHYF